MSADGSLSELESQPAPTAAPQDAEERDGEPSFAVLQLADGAVAKVSPCDFERLAKHLWHVVSIRGHRYAATSIAGRRTYMHRMVMNDPRYWDERHGKWRAMHIDHVDGCGLHNERPNLRTCTPMQNQANNHGHPNRRRSKFKGVSFYPGRARPWRCTLTKAGLQHSFGYYATEREAARMYNVMAQKLFGEFARLNTLDSDANSKAIGKGERGSPP